MRASHEVICKRHGENRVIFVETDVTVGTVVAALVQEAVKVCGRRDIMVNNAGIGGTEHQGSIHEIKEET